MKTTALVLNLGGASFGVTADDIDMNAIKALLSCERIIFLFCVKEHRRAFLTRQNLILFLAIITMLFKVRASARFRLVLDEEHVLSHLKSHSYDRVVIKVSENWPNVMLHYGRQLFVLGLSEGSSTGSLAFLKRVTPLPTLAAVSNFTA